MEDQRSIYVYFDFAFQHMKAGRIVIELYKRRSPVAAENFRCLCTGENGIGMQGKPLHYKGSKIHKVIRYCMIQGGDIINGDGTGGDTIYGQYFPTEINKLNHMQPGVVGLVCDVAQQNNTSQFYITTEPCPQLDRENTIIGRVVKGLDIIKSINDLPIKNDIPQVSIEIVDCGEFMPNEPWGIEENDGTPDVYPPFPSDWDVELNGIEVSNAVQNINESGNIFFKNEDYIESERKYQKALRYIDWYLKKIRPENDEMRVFSDLKNSAWLNICAVYLRMNKNHEAIEACNQVIKMKPNSAKAIYRRGCAKLELKDYDEAIRDLKLAYRLRPNDRNIKTTFEVAKKNKQVYLNHEKILYKKILNL